MTAAPMRGASAVLAAAGAMLAVSLGPAPGHVRPCVAAVADFPHTTRVVLFTPPTSDPLIARLEAELAAVGITVRRMAMPADSQLDSVVTTEIATGASAVIRVIPRSRGTEVWTGDTTARVLRRRSIRADISDAALSVIALRTVEFLRASLLDVKRREAAGAASAVGGSAGGGARAAAGEPPGREGAGPDRNSTERGGRASSPAVAGPPATRSTETAAARATTEAAAARASEAAAGRASEAAAARIVEGSGGARTGEAPEARAGQGAPPPTSRAIAPRPSVESPGAPGNGGGEGDGDTAARRTDADVTRTREPSRPAKPGADSLEIAIGPALLASPGGIDPVASAAAIGRGRVKGNTGIELMAIFPIVPSRVTNAEGSVEVNTALFGAAVTYRPTLPGPWLIDAATGVSALMVRARGSAVGSVGAMPVANASAVVSAWTAVWHLRAGAGYQLNRWLALRLDVLGGLAASQVVLQYRVTGSNQLPVPGLGADRASFGRLFAGGALGLQASW